MRKFEILVVITVAVLGTLFTFSFGSLIAMDHMAGVLGVPFLFFLILFCSILIFSKNRKTRKTMRIILASYLLTLISYSITILILRSGTDEVFEHLYQDNVGDSNLAEKLLSWYCVSGIILCAILLFVTNTKKKNK